MDRKEITQQLVVSSTEDRGAEILFRCDLATNAVRFEVSCRTGNIWKCPKFETHTFGTYAEAQEFFNRFCESEVAE